MALDPWEQAKLKPGGRSSGGIGIIFGFNMMVSRHNPKSTLNTRGSCIPAFNAFNFDNPSLFSLAPHALHTLEAGAYRAGQLLSLKVSFCLFAYSFSVQTNQLNTCPI